MLIDLDPVDRITADAIGPPGQRVFYLQARGAGRLVTLLVEKQQVELLAASLIQLVARTGHPVEEEPSDEAMELEQPVVPEWRAGRLSIGYEESRDRVILEVEELVEEDEEEAEQDPERVRFWTSREQAVALARHGAAVCARGRPRCELCGNPIEPGGHVCPALNGHGELG